MCALEEGVYCLDTRESMVSKIESLQSAAAQQSQTETQTQPEGQAQATEEQDESSAEVPVPQVCVLHTFIIVAFAENHNLRITLPAAF